MINQMYDFVLRTFCPYSMFFICLNWIKLEVFETLQSDFCWTLLEWQVTRVSKWSDLIGASRAALRLPTDTIKPFKLEGKYPKHGFKPVNKLDINLFVHYIVQDKYYAARATAPPGWISYLLCWSEWAFEQEEALRNLVNLVLRILKPDERNENKNGFQLNSSDIFQQVSAQIFENYWMFVRNSALALCSTRKLKGRLKGEFKQWEFIYFIDPEPL